MAERQTLERLTAREREVLALIGEGLTSVEIAQRLNRSEKTIRSHRFAIGRKLGLRNRVELTRAAIEAGLVTVRAPEPTAEDRSEKWDQVLEAIESIVTRGGEASYFEMLTAKLAQALSARCAVVGEFADKKLSAIRIVGMWQDDAFTSGAVLPIDVTPCRLCAELGTVVLEKDATKHLPEVNNVVGFKAACYWGVLLNTADGAPMGSLCVISDKPLDGRLQPSRLLRIFAARAGSELRRRQNDARA